ncbi:MAG TPA: hypothetical protein VMS76_11795 [Planctomycetota bacterium]|nr:hypothetical protein [Planctomycetota bacterium]
MKFVGEVTLGNVLTAASVLIALSGLLYSQWRDRAQDRALRAAEARAGAGQAIAEFRRLDNEVLLFFHNVEPAYVRVSEALGEHRDLARARDALWLAISEERAEMERRIADGARREGYAALALRHPRCHTAVEGQLKDASFQQRSAVFARLAEATQDEVLGMADEMAAYTSAELGNRLRRAHRTALEAEYRPTAAEDSGLVETLSQIMRGELASGDCPA